MARIDGLMYGENPRNGYFESNRFLHPGLEFRLDLPQGWQVRNLAQAVVAGSPSKDAMIQMTLAEGARQAAADAFFGQQGVTAGRVTRETVNGLGAIVGQFQAQTEQGALGGIAAFITHRDRTYRILAYTPVAKLPNYEGTFLRSINSFARLTDRAALARQPDRVAIVQLSQPMTLAQFNQRYPSVVPMQELAIINQVAGAGTMLPANFLAKRVVDR